MLSWKKMLLCVNLSYIAYDTFFASRMMRKLISITLPNVDEVVAFPKAEAFVAFVGNQSGRSSAYSPLFQRGSSGSGHVLFNWVHSAVKIWLYTYRHRRSRCLFSFLKMWTIKIFYHQLRNTKNRMLDVSVSTIEDWTTNPLQQ